MVGERSWLSSVQKLQIEATPSKFRIESSRPLNFISIRSISWITMIKVLPDSSYWSKKCSNSLWLTIAGGGSIKPRIIIHETFPTTRVWNRRGKCNKSLRLLIKPGNLRETTCQKWLSSIIIDEEVQKVCIYRSFFDSIWGDIIAQATSRPIQIQLQINRA